MTTRQVRKLLESCCACVDVHSEFADQTQLSWWMAWTKNATATFLCFIPHRVCQSARWRAWRAGWPRLPPYVLSHPALRRRRASLTDTACDSLGKGVPVMVSVARRPAAAFCTQLGGATGSCRPTSSVAGNAAFAMARRSVLFSLQPRTQHVTACGPRLPGGSRRAASPETPHPQWRARSRWSGLRTHVPHASS